MGENKTYILNEAHRQELVKFDCSILVEVHFSDHVPDLVAGYTLTQGLQNITNLCHRDVTVAISIKLERKRMCVCVCVCVCVCAHV